MSPADDSPSPAGMRPLSVGATILVVAVGIIYLTVGPWISRRLGVHLPGLPAGQQAAPETTDAAGTDVKDRGADPQGQGGRQSSTDDGPAPVNRGGAELEHGLLKTLPNGAKTSPAGLRYRQERHEHRLDHVLRHAADQPNRDIHGVFHGGAAKTLAVIDEAYTKAREGGSGVRRREEDDRVIYDVQFNRAIGFLGGKAGARQQNPDLRRVRLVLEGQDVVTAYPIR